MWAKNVFLKLFFIYLFLGPFAFQGGHCFGEIIYFSALDLKPASLNLRPAQFKFDPRSFFTHISINTPVVSTLNSYFIWSFLEVPAGIF
jgi:hypothetical protein